VNATGSAVPDIAIRPQRVARTSRHARCPPRRRRHRHTVQTNSEADQVTARISVEPPSTIRFGLAGSTPMVTCRAPSSAVSPRRPRPARTSGWTPLGFTVGTRMMEAWPRVGRGRRMLQPRIPSLTPGASAVGGTRVPIGLGPWYDGQVPCVLLAGSRCGQADVFVHCRHKTFPVCGGRWLGT
jgi:hypothetical protein